MNLCTERSAPWQIGASIRRAANRECSISELNGSQEEKRMDELDADLVAETENYMVWTSEVEGEVMFHLELGGISLHLTDEEWDELVTLMRVVLR